MPSHPWELNYKCNALLLYKQNNSTCKIMADYFDKAATIIGNETVNNNRSLSTIKAINYHTMMLKAYLFQDESTLASLLLNFQKECREADFKLFDDTCFQGLIKEQFHNVDNKFTYMYR